MIKTCFTFFIFIVSINLAKAQTKAESGIIYKYGLKEISVNDSSKFLYVFVPPSANQQTKNFFIKNNIRSFNDSAFIIHKSLLKNISTKNDLFKIYAPGNNIWKLSPSVNRLIADDALSITTFNFLLNYNDVINPDSLLLKYASSINGFAIDKSLQLISIKTTPAIINKLFINDSQILAIDVNIHAPKEELAIKGFDLSTNKINKVHSLYPDINGSGMHVSIKENFYDTSDIDLKGRLDPSPLASHIITNHANFMATIIAGGGNSIYYSKGAAWGANISSSSFDLILPDSNNYYLQNDITVQNHSYGTDIENTYGLNAVAFDKSANQDPLLLHVFSSGNSGNVTSVSGNYSGVAGFANLTGNFKMAKNNLVVGAVDSFGTVAPLSSRGPAYDGRIKPEIVAFQMNGTSEAAALVSGSTLLLQQYYKSITGLSLPSALAKALLINSADDVNNPGPDYATGFGNMNVIKAMEEIKNNTITNGQLTNGEVKTFPISIPPNINKLKVTLVWNDTASSGFASKALINDLDLSVSLPFTGTTWKPWVLNSFPNPDSLSAPAQRKRDSLNNVEQVTIDNPLPGIYNLNVTGYNVPSAKQQFYIAYQLDTANYFNWYHPSKTDFIEPGKQSLVRWTSTYSGTGSLDFAYVASSSWNPISANISLGQNNYEWLAPDTIARAVFRMKIGSSYYYSDTFSIAKLLSPKIGYICGDSLLMYWEKLKGNFQYQVYNLGQKYMTPFSTVSDTSIIIHKNALQDNYLAVGYLLPDNVISPKSYAFDYNIQGSGCYINTFLAEANSNTANLSLIIGTTFNIDSISFEILSPFGFHIIYTTTPFTANLNYTYTYRPLNIGINYFRAKIILKNGTIIYSDRSYVYFMPPGQYALFPVPARKNEPVQLLSNIPDEEIIQVINSVGQVVLSKQIKSTLEQLSTTGLNTGIYFYRILKNGKKLMDGKIIII